MFRLHELARPVTSEEGGGGGGGGCPGAPFVYKTTN